MMFTSLDQLVIQLVDHAEGRHTSDIEAGLGSGFCDLDMISILSTEQDLQVLRASQDRHVGGCFFLLFSLLCAVALLLGWRSCSAVL